MPRKAKSRLTYRKNVNKTTRRVTKTTGVVEEQVIDQLNQFPVVGEVDQHLGEPTDDNVPVVDDAEINLEEVIVLAVASNTEEQFKHVNLQPNVVVMVNSQNLVSSSDDDSDDERTVYNYTVPAKHGMKRLRSVSPLMVNVSKRQKIDDTNCVNDENLDAIVLAPPPLTDDVPEIQPDIEEDVRLLECRCYLVRKSTDLCPLHEVDLSAVPNDDTELEVVLDNDPSLWLSSDIIDELQIPLENEEFEGPVDLEFGDVEPNVIINPNSDNERDRENDAYDRRDLELEIQRIRNRDGQVLTYLEATRRNNVPINSVGMMDQFCRKCRARYFRKEGTTRNEYNKCCNKGEIQLPPLGQHPEELKQLFTGQHPLSNEFVRKILTYNNSFQFVSIESNLRDIPGHGPYVYAIQGKIYHHFTNINVNRANMKYGPLYFLDPEQAVEQRAENARRQTLNVALLGLITDQLQQVNAFARVYRHLGEVYEEQRAEMGNALPSVCLEFVEQHRNRNDREHDARVVNEVAIVANYDENNPPNPRMRVFLRDHDDRLRDFDSTSQFCDPLSYPLLFPRGDLGWNTNIPLVQARANRKRDRVSICDFYAYRLYYRQTNDFQILEHGGKLMQQFIVDAYLKIEANRISYFVHNQDLLRTEEYYGLVDYLHNRAEQDNVPLGKMIILPSTFEMSPRNQMQRFQDAMAVVSELGCPSFFITMTCNPKWSEIQANLPAGQEAINHPLLVDRIFKMKLDDLIVDLAKNHVMGVCISYLYVIEFQKRGLPHAHILITLRNEDKPLDPVRIDQLISAELPDPDTENDLYKLVGRHMIHGPCGQYNPTDVCMVNGECIRKFPKYWYNNTTIRNGRVYHRRRRLNGRTIEIHRNNHRYVVDSRFVVPYNPYLLLKYQTHINVETCTSTGTVKYLYKYFFKGPDQSLVRVVEHRNAAQNDGEQGVEMRYDEIRSYLNGRYMTPPEASWRILKFPMHVNSHTVFRLAIHLPGRQRVYFRRGEEQAILQRARVANTHLTAWFELNSNNPEARQYLFREIPLHFVWDKNHNQWKNRQRNFDKIVSRMYNVSVRNGELYYLRVLLLRVRGATSFESLRTVNGLICDTFQEACRQLNLLAEDREWIRCLREASEKDMPKQMRQMFAYILVFCQVDNPIQLWNDFKRFMMEDFTRRDRMDERQAEIRALQKIQFILMINGRRLSQFGLEDPPDFRPNLVEDEVDQVREREIGETMLEQLNIDQRNVFEVVMRAVENDDEGFRYFFVSGAAGTGKTFLYNTLTTVLNGRGEKVIAVAWTGIAAALLKHGRTVHNRFKLPVPIVENSTSSLTAQCEETRFIREAKLIIWDEITMTTRSAFELVDKTLKDICQNNRPFGGKCVILGGDFKQCLPVVPDGDRTTIVANCIKSSFLWFLFVNIQLNINMRVRPDEIEFLEWLGHLGNGTLPPINFNNVVFDENEPTQLERRKMIEIPRRCIVNDLNELIDRVFGGQQFQAETIPINTAILTPFNANCHLINALILDRIEGTVRTYQSVDTVITDDETEAANYPEEFLNSLNPPSFSQHELKLKVGTIVMLLRNLNVKANLCNGTRLIVRHLGEHHIEAEIINFDGRLSGKRIFLPQIDFVSGNSPLPFVMRRRQFPIRLSYCMTINKSQGQTFDSVGIYLPRPVFTHGQLYVAFSRARTAENISVCLEGSTRQDYISLKAKLKLYSIYTENITFLRLTNNYMF